jgi:3-hydroxyacyl-CoA dehydrogenase/enoyl-CoA hydratase/3-hydroxybutyryl-CoA epimerase
MKDLDLVIEAVPEIPELKARVFDDLEAVISPLAVIASNTSSLPISGLAGRARNPERFVGMHFFSPAEVMPLVEVVAAASSSQRAVATVVELAVRMGKVPVVVRDSPGFLVNRVLAAYALEAAQMVEEGVPPQKVDAAALKFGMPVGPIRLVAEVGVEVMIKVLHQIQAHFGANLASPKWIERPDLGAAFARGKDGKWTVLSRVIKAWVGKEDPGLPAGDISDRMFCAMLNESVRCLDEGLVAKPAMLDLAMVYATGYPPEKGGPLRDADRRGLAEMTRRGRELAKAYGPLLEPPALLQKAASNGIVFLPREEVHDAA